MTHLEKRKALVTSDSHVVESKHSATTARLNELYSITLIDNEPFHNTITLSLVSMTSYCLSLSLCGAARWRNSSSFTPGTSIRIT